jgi:hypothetical protein
MYGFIGAELTVRIHSPPADSPGLAQTRALPVEKPAVPRGCALAEVRQRHEVLAKVRKPALLSLSGDIPVPQYR